MSNTLAQRQGLPQVGWPALDRAVVMSLTALLLITSVARFVVGAREPLWLDETWTGMIASQTSFAGFCRQVYDDINAPLYFVIARLWAEVAGLSNGALRFPATFFGVLAPLAALLPTRAIQRPQRLLWCALLACWIPGLWFSQDARCYTLLFLLAVTNSVTFASVLQRPSLPAATAWTLVSALMVLTHYYAGLLVAAQGLTYLAMHRMRAVRTWPAALAFAPAAAWMIYHLPRLLGFAMPDVAWYPVLGPRDILPSLSFLFGAYILLAYVPGWAAAALIIGRARAEPEPPTRSAGDGGLWICAALALATALALVAIGSIRPSFSDRYLTSLAPGVLLGLTLVARVLARRWAAAPLVLVILFGAAAGAWAIKAVRHGDRPYSLQAASDALMDAGVGRVVFLWDHPMGGPVAESVFQLRAVGGFLFERGGHPVTVDAVLLHRGEDPNSILLARAGGANTGILWLYDTAVANTAAKARPPTIDKLDPRWRCRNFGRGGIGVIACAHSAGLRGPISG